MCECVCVGVPLIRQLGAMGVAPKGWAEKYIWDTFVVR